MVHKFFDKNSKGSGRSLSSNNEIKQNTQLADELHKPIIRKFEKRERCILHLEIIFVVRI